MDGLYRIEHFTDFIKDESYHPHWVSRSVRAYPLTEAYRQASEYRGLVKRACKGMHLTQRLVDVETGEAFDLDILEMIFGASE